MRGITIEAKSLGPAHRLYNALAAFHPELSGSEDEGYRVSVELRTDERRLLDVLDAIEGYVTDANDGPARLDVGGHRYTMHAVPS